MPDRPGELDPKNPRWFEKQDRAVDTLFYAHPRKVTHIDKGAVGAVTQLYRELLPEGGAILDLMSSWRSHLPPEARYKRVSGLGMNAEEMRDNPQLSDFSVADLNAAPVLPYSDGAFDGACCCVSVQYLQRPVEVFREVARVLKPGGPFVVSFSNRCFPSKAVAIWLGSDDAGHLRVVESYFQGGGPWADIRMADRSPKRGDPLLAVWARRATALELPRNAI
jgi:SAM-dependent methyltransferase